MRRILGRPLLAGGFSLTLYSVYAIIYSMYDWAGSSWTADAPKCTTKPLGRDDCCRIRCSLLGKRYRLGATGSVRSAEPAETRIDNQQEDPPPEVACLDRGKYVRISRLSCRDSSVGRAHPW